MERLIADKMKHNKLLCPTFKKKAVSWSNGITVPNQSTLACIFNFKMEGSVLQDNP